MKKRWNKLTEKERTNFLLGVYCLWTFGLFFAGVIVGMGGNERWTTGDWLALAGFAPTILAIGAFVVLLLCMGLSEFAKIVWKLVKG